jgi:hypothetical protein
MHDWGLKIYCIDIDPNKSLKSDTNIYNTLLPAKYIKLKPQNKVVIGYVFKIKV